MSKDLIDAALSAKARAYAPYSSYRVGAALRDEAGNIHRGCNVENAAFPQGLCAEAAALAAMVVAGGKRCLEIAVLADGQETVTPCGGCRQKLREFGGDEMRILACDGTGRVKHEFHLGELLPFSFGPSQLGSQS